MEVEEVVGIARRVFMDATLEEKSRLEQALGYDSLTHLQFVIELERKAGCRIVDDIAQTATLQEVSKLVSRQA